MSVLNGKSLFRLARNLHHPEFLLIRTVPIRNYSARLSSERSTRRPIPRTTPRSGLPSATSPQNTSPAHILPEATNTNPQTTLEGYVPVRLPERDRPDAVLDQSSGAYLVLAHPALMVTRQMEMINVLIGYEQANKYALKDATGTDVGFIAEEETSFSGMLSRQLLRTRRPFKAVVLDRNGNVVLKISRPMKWLLNSKIFVHDADDRLIGEVQQVWHLLRRKYDLFLKTTQHSLVDAPFLSWDFNLMNETDQVLATVNRNFTGFAREIFTDFGQYAVHFDDTSPTALSLDERALILACAINIDIDYFSRHSHGSGGLLHGFMPFPMMGGSHHEAGNVPAPSPVGGDMVGTMGTVGAVSGGASVAGDIAAVGAGAVAGQAIGGVMGGGRAAPDMVGQNMPPPPPSTAPVDQTNQWGDSPFLSDEEAGVSTSEGGGGGGGWGDMMRDFFED